MSNLARKTKRFTETSDLRPVLSPDLREFVEILQNLLNKPSVVGAEDAFFQILRQELEFSGVRVQTSKGLLVAQGSKPESLILSAHIDRHGLICTAPGEFQYAAHVTKNLRKQQPRPISLPLAETLRGRYQGLPVQAHLPVTGAAIGQGKIADLQFCQTSGQLIFRLEGLGRIKPGTPVAFPHRLRIRDGLLSAQLDNVISVALLLFLFRRGFQGTALFTAQEEAGRSWRYALAWFRQQQRTTQRLIVLDTSPYPTRRSAAAQQLVLRRKDALGVFSTTMTQELESRCRGLGFSYQHKDIYAERWALLSAQPVALGRTELGRLVSASSGAVNGTTLQIPTSGYHTIHETATLDSVAAALHLLKTYIP